jgi:hypothetical protein
MPTNQKILQNPAMLTPEEIIEMVEKFCEDNGLGCVCRKLPSDWYFCYNHTVRSICYNETAIRRDQEGEWPITTEDLNFSLLHELGHAKDMEAGDSDFYEDAGYHIKLDLMEDLKVDYESFDSIIIQADILANYYHLPYEKRANDLMGLDFRELIYAKSGVYPSRKWQSNPAKIVVGLEIPKEICLLLGKEAVRLGRKYGKRIGSEDYDIDIPFEALKNLKKKSVKYLRFLMSVYPLFMTNEWLEYHMPKFQNETP